MKSMFPAASLSLDLYPAQRWRNTNEKITRRPRVAPILPNPASCLRLPLPLCVETHRGWLEEHGYLNMEFLREQKKDLPQSAA